MRVPLIRRPVAALALSVLLAGAFSTTADPARAVDRYAAKPPAPLPAPSLAALDESFGRLPLQFEVNRGQADPRVRYLTRSRGSTLFLTDDEAVWVLSREETAAAAAERKDRLAPSERDGERGTRASSVVRMSLEGSKPKPRLDGLGRLPGDVNYFIGNDPKKWRTDVPTFRKVKVENVYDGIDLLYYGNQRQVEYDFVVKPGVDPSVIRIAFTGADRISTDAAGDLVVATRAGDLRMKSPLVYQERDGQRELVAAAYVVRPGETKVEFRLAQYDRTRDLVIDPVIVWSTYVGPLNGSLFGVAAPAGELILAGYTHHEAFPTTPGVVFPVNPSNHDFNTGVVLRLNAAGTGLVYSTFVGSPIDNYFCSVASDSSGAAYVTGWTRDGADYPTTPGGDIVPGSTIVVTKVSPGGNALEYSARIGGSTFDTANDIAVDSSGHAYVCGRIEDGSMPVPPGAFQGLSAIGADGSGFAAKLSPTGNAIVWATILGGVVPTAPSISMVASSEATSIEPDGTGGAFVAGHTNVADFPTTPGAFRVTHTASTGVAWDIFLLKLNPTATAAAYSTFLGGGGEESARIALDRPRVVPDPLSGAAYVVGHAFGTFPSTPGAFEECCTGGFVTKVLPDGSGLVYSTFLSETHPPWIRDVAVDPNGFAVIVGVTYSVGDFPVTPPNDPSPAAGPMFVARLDPTGSLLSYGSRFGPVMYDTGIEGPTSVVLLPGGDVIVVGNTGSRVFPTTPGSYQPTDPDPRLSPLYPTDGFVARFGLPVPVSVLSITPATGPSLGGTAITITGTGFQTGAVVRIGGVPATVSTVTATSISAVTGPHPDGLVDIEVENPDGGIALLKNVFTYVCGGTAPTATLTGDGAVCAGQSATLSVALTGAGPWNLVWSDGFAQNGIGTSPATRDVSPLATTTYTVRTATDSTCAGASSGSALVTVNPVPASTLAAPSRVCAGLSASASVPSTPGATYSWTVTNGTVDSGQGTASIFFTATSSPVTVAVVATLGSCNANASRDIPVSAVPTATVSGGGAICAGASTTVSFDLSGSPPFIVAWSDGVSQTVAAAGAGTRSVSPGATRTYTIVSLADATTCPGGSSTGSATVTVNPLPSVIISSPASYCSGASGLVASVPDAGPGATYAWTIAGGAFVGGSAASSVAFTPAGPAVTLGVTVTLPTTCSASSTHVASLAPAPSAVVSGGGTICAGTEAVIQASLVGTPPFTLTWSDGVVQAGVASTTARRTVRPTAPTTYTVTALQDANCTGSAAGSAVFSVVAAPSALVTSPVAMICPGGSASIVVQLGGPGPYHLVWSDGLVETVTGPQVVREVSPGATTTYAIDSVGNGTCTVKGLGATRVVVFPDASASRISAPAEVCADSTGHAASVPDAGAGTTYAWSITNGAIVSGQGSRSVAFTAGTAGETALSVTVRVAGGCAVSGSARVRVNARPAVPTITAPASLESGATGVVAEVVGAAGPAFTWTILNGVITAGAGTSRITFTAGDPGVVVLDVVERNPKGCDSPAGHLEIPVRGLSTVRLAPIVLDVAAPGGKRFSTEVAITNPSPSPVRVDVLYTPATSLDASGPGSASETLGAGQQRVIPDVLAWLREKGLAIPADGSSQGGTLRVTFDGVAAGWTPSATTRTTVASGAGRAGLSMPALDPDAATSSKVWLFGLRENAADRSHVALLNAGVEGSVDLRVTLFSGEGTSVPKHVLPVVRLGAGQWLQLNAVLRQAGFASGYALVERLAGTVPFHAYAVFNDNVTNDGSVVPATPFGRLGGARFVPVVVETSAFTSELVLANPAAFPVRARLWFTESLANPGGISVGGVTVELAAGEQKILPGILAEMRNRGLTIQPPRHDYAGTLSVTFSASGEPAEGWAGARTATTDGSAGRYGLFCPAHAPDPSTGQAWLFGLLQNGDTRSNLALVNAAANLGPVTLRYHVFDGVTGKKVATSDPVTVAPGAWMQLNGFLSRWKLENGYVRVERTGGTAPFFAYAVVNDGGIPGTGTGDGSYVEMSTPSP